MKQIVAVVVFAALVGVALCGGPSGGVPVREFHDKVARIGYKAPDFEAPAVVGKNFQQLKLSDYAGKWVVLLFYPLDYTFVCPTELIAFSERHNEFEAINAQVIGISVDSKFTHLAWANTPRNHGGLGGISFPLVSDLTRQVSELYGAMYLETGHSLRALFVIDPTQKLRSMTVHDDQVGRNVDEVLRVVQAFQYADSHGEVCPANWKPGDKTMKPSPTESKQYFETVFQEKI